MIKAADPRTKMSQKIWLIKMSKNTLLVEKREYKSRKIG